MDPANNEAVTQQASLQQVAIGNSCSEIDKAVEKVPRQRGRPRKYPQVVHQGIRPTGPSTSRSACHGSNVAVAQKAVLCTTLDGNGEKEEASVQNIRKGTPNVESQDFEKERRRRARMLARMMETEEEREARLRRAREASMLARMMETEEERETRLKRARDYMRTYRRNMADKQPKGKNMYDKMWKQMRRQTEPDEEREAPLKGQRNSVRKYLGNLSEEERKRRCTYRQIWNRRKLRTETQEEREVRLEKKRRQYALQAERKRQQHLEETVCPPADPGKS